MHEADRGEKPGSAADKTKGIKSEEESRYLAVPGQTTQTHFPGGQSIRQTHLGEPEEERLLQAEPSAASD